MSKLCGATDKFIKSCRKIEKELAAENAAKMQTQTKKKKAKDSGGLESLLREEQVEEETSADEVVVE